MNYLTIAGYTLKVENNVDLKINEIGNYGVRQRITEQLKQYWEHKKCGRNFPSEADIDTSELGDNWKSCFLIKYDSPQFTYTYLGEELVSAYGDDFHQREICEKLVFPCADVLELKFHQVLQTARWLEYDDDFVNSNGLLVRYRSIIVPLGKNNNNNEIGFLLGAMRWKAYL